MAASFQPTTAPFGKRSGAAPKAVKNGARPGQSARGGAGNRQGRERVGTNETMPKRTSEPAQTKLFGSGSPRRNRRPQYGAGSMGQVSGSPA